MRIYRSFRLQARPPRDPLQEQLQAFEPPNVVTALLANRLSVSKRFLLDDGVLGLAIDDHGTQTRVSLNFRTGNSPDTKFSRLLFTTTPDPGLGAAMFLVHTNIVGT